MKFALWRFYFFPVLAFDKINIQLFQKPSLKTAFYGTQNDCVSDLFEAGLAACCSVLTTLIWYPMHGAKIAKPLHD